MSRESWSADGVHLGQDDMPVKSSARILGPDALIGVSAHSIEQVRQAVLDGASYLGVGPTFPSRTKKFSEFPGLDFVRAVAAETMLPAFVIGGVNLETVVAASAAGARRAAVSQVLCHAEDPRAAAGALVRKRCQVESRLYNLPALAFPPRDSSCDPIRSSSC